VTFLEETISTLPIVNATHFMDRNLVFRLQLLPLLPLVLLFLLLLPLALLLLLLLLLLHLQVDLS
jgi:hypothetical protein